MFMKGQNQIFCAIQPSYFGIFLTCLTNEGMYYLLVSKTCKFF
jgi:hypothetical protein